MAEIQYGFLQIKDILGNPVTNDLLPRINTAIEATLTEYNRQLSALTGLFCERVTESRLRYESPLIKRLQALDENGRARITKGAGYYDLAFPIQMAGDAWGTNYVTSQFLTVQHINNWLTATLTADKLWVKDHLLAALYADASWAFTEPQIGDLTILPLANGDSQVYLIQTGQIAGATDNHLQGYNHTISDTYNPFPALRRELVEHPENGGQTATVIALCASDLIDDIEGLTSFREVRDPDIAYGSGTDILQGRLDQSIPGVVRGKTNNVWIVEWGSQASGVITGVTVEGSKPLGMREYDKPALQGFIELPNRSDTPYLERQFQRHVGFGAYNRVGAVNIKVGAASWSTPSGFESPLP